MEGRENRSVPEGVGANRLALSTSSHQFGTSFPFQVGYLAGSNGQPLLPQYLSDLDSALIPVIHGGACQLSEGPVVMELIFYILEIIS